jgi:hypothetical protein
LEQPVSQGGFAVIDMRNNAKIPDVLHVQLTSIFRGSEGSEKQRGR